MCSWLAQAQTPRERFKLLLDFKRTGYPDDHSPQPDAGTPGQLGFAALHWSRSEVANALRAMESMRFVEQQARVAKGIADKAAAQLTYLMESPCLRGVTRPAATAPAPIDSPSFGACHLPVPLFQHSNVPRQAFLTHKRKEDALLSNRRQTFRYLCAPLQLG